MRSGFFVFASLLLLAGCTSNVDLTQYGDVQMQNDSIHSVALSFPGEGDPDKMLMCIAKNVSNDAVVMTNSGGFVGQATGRYHSATANYAVGGGSVLQYVSADGSHIVANGEKGFARGIAQASLRFMLDIKQKGGARTYEFTKIEQAGTYNGYGYGPVGIMPGQGGGQVLDTLKALAGQLELCMN